MHTSKHKLSTIHTSKHKLSTMYTSKHKLSTIHTSKLNTTGKVDITGKVEIKVNYYLFTKSEERRYKEVFVNSNVC